MRREVVLRARSALTSKGVAALGVRRMSRHCVSDA